MKVDPSKRSTASLLVKGLLEKTNLEMLTLHLLHTINLHNLSFITFLFFSVVKWNFITLKNTILQQEENWPARVN